MKQYPIVGACGLDCGLCPRYHTAGSSKCPGCAGPDFEQKHPACGFVTCCVKQKHLETCAQCPDRASCERVSRVMEVAKQGDSFISYRPLPANYAFIQRYGIEEFARQEMAKIELLSHLLKHYDEGRSKTFYCIASQLIPLDSLKVAVAEAEAQIRESANIKEKSRLVRGAISHQADTLGIDLRLRK